MQKCIRTNDIEEVGKTPRHGTFFQMLGNWSFGDYFKEGAITYAWELLTSSEADGGLGFDPKDLWVTVYEEDDEALELWKRIAGLPEERIQRLGKDTNYWSTGPARARPARAPRSSSTAVPAYGIDGGPATDDDRYVEIWNLVFMQYAIDDVRSKYDFRIVGELPNKNIDTGMGLERVAFIKQGVDNMYETDQVRPVLDRAVELSGKRLRRRPRGRRAVPHRRRPRALVAHAALGRRHARRTRAAATSCAASCAAPSARCACSASTARPSPSCSPRRATR